MINNLTYKEQVEKEKQELRTKLLEFFLKRKTDCGSFSSIQEGIDRIDTALDFITEDNTKSITNDVPVDSKGYLSLKRINYGASDLRQKGAPMDNSVNTIILSAEVNSENVNN